MNPWAFSELERRLANLIRVGIVAELDEEAARVRVEIGRVHTAWLPWLTQRAGADRTWWAPEVGEQVLVLSPGGELSQAVVMPALYQSAYAPPAASKNVHLTEYSDGTRVQYDRAARKLTISTVGSVEITASSVDITSSINLIGTMTVTGGDVVADGISLKQHTHTDTPGTGAGETSPPNQ